MENSSENITSHPPPANRPLSQEESDRIFCQQLQDEEYAQSRRQEQVPPPPVQPNPPPRPTQPANPSQTLYQHPQQQPVYSMKQLHITLVEAKLARSCSRIANMDPYVRLRLGHNIFQTATAAGMDKTPRWEQRFICPYTVGADILHLEVVDDNTFSEDEVIAKAAIPIPPIVFNGQTVDDWYQLHGVNDHSRNEGLINIVISCYDVPNTLVQYYHYPQPIPRQQAPPIRPEDIQTLREMFPNMDEEIIIRVLQSKAGNKEAAVSALLAMTNE